MTSIASTAAAKGIDDALAAGIETEVLADADAAAAAREIALAAGAPCAPPPKIKTADDATKRKAGNRFASINDFVDYTMRGLPASEIAVWVILWRDERDGTARTAQADLARRAGVDARTVRRAVANLKRRGLLKIVHRGGLHRGPSRYRVSPRPQ